MNEAECTRLVRVRAASPYPDISDIHTLLPCECCGQFSDTLERHHRQYRSRGGEWTPSNIVLICRPDHNRVDADQQWAIQSGMAVHSWDHPELAPVCVWYCKTPVLLRDDGCYLPISRQEYHDGHDDRA